MVGRGLSIGASSFLDPPQAALMASLTRPIGAIRDRRRPPPYDPETIARK